MLVIFFGSSYGNPIGLILMLLLDLAFNPMFLRYIDYFSISDISIYILLLFIN